MVQKIGWWCCRAIEDAAPKAGCAENSKAHRVQRWAFVLPFALGESCGASMRWWGFAKIKKPPKRLVYFNYLWKWQPVGESNPSYLVENQVS